jgi:hypothetical protein
MSKFLHILEQYNPDNTGDPKWELIDFLKSKGVKVSMVRGTDMLYIDTGSNTIAVTVSNNEEEAESIEAGTGTYKVDQEVEKLGNAAASGMKGLMARGLGTSAQKAKSAVKKRQTLAGQAVKTYEDSTKALERSLQNARRSQSIPVNY